MRPFPTTKTDHKDTRAILNSVPEGGPELLQKFDLARIRTAVAGSKHMIEGVSHITFVVRDLERMKVIIETVLDGKEVYSSGDDTFSIAREKFFLIAGLWVAIMEGDPLERPSYNHLALKISEDRLDEYRRRIEGLGLRILPGRARIEGEGRSVYFYDEDNHLFELHTGTLEQRLQRYNGERNR